MPLNDSDIWPRRIVPADGELDRDRSDAARRQELLLTHSPYSRFHRRNHRIGLICNDTGLSKSVVNKYLSVLIDLKLVHRRIPVTEG